MVCVVLADMTGVTKNTVTDKDVLDYLADVNRHFGRQAFEVRQQDVFLPSGVFRKEKRWTEFALFYDCNGTEWQYIQCAGPTKGALCAYLIGYAGGLEDSDRNGEKQNDPKN